MTNVEETNNLEEADSVTAYLLGAKPKSVFDSGFGDCKWLEWCIKHGIDYQGVEIDPALVKKAREKYPDHASKLYEGDLTAGGLVSIPDNSVDVVLSIEVVEHIHNVEHCLRMLKECARIARDKVIITTPNCGDEDLLKKHGLTYLHYTHVATEGMKFTIDRAHRHWIKFTKSSLTDLLKKEFTHFRVTEKRPIQILKVVCYDKLWAEIDVRKEKHNDAEE